MSLRSNITSDVINQIANLTTQNGAFVLYFSIFKELPNALKSIAIDHTGVLEHVREKFSVTEKDIFSINLIAKGKTDDVVANYICVAEEKLLYCISDEYLTFFYPFDLNFEVAKNYVYEIEEKFNALAKKGPELCLIVQKDYGLELTKMSIEKVQIDLALNYNNDFKEVNEKILEDLNKKNHKGLVLLHGKPGTGKTSYLRYLIREIKNKEIIFVTTDVALQIGKPSFLNFMLTHPNSILVIEDAELILKNREEGGINEMISSLLNLSDGLLSDCLHLQIICTFNTEIKNIDKALLREGRLICRYEFGVLDLERTNLLLSSMYGPETVSKKEMTISEIFNYIENPIIKIEGPGKIGF